LRFTASNGIKDNQRVDLEICKMKVDVDAVQTDRARRVDAMVSREGNASVTGRLRVRALASTSPMSTPPSWVKRIESPSRADVMQYAKGEEGRARR
jgi:hypothetical protein